MNSIISRRSNLSNQTQKVIEEVASKSLAKIYSLQGVFTDQQIRVVWNALGLYISKNLRAGRGVNIPKFGIFTFTPPEVRLNGVTNPEDRDTKPRNPVFVVSKDFVRGKDLRPAIYFHQQFGAGIRAYTVYGSNGEVPIAKLNLTEVASYANMSKDSTETAFHRIIKHLSEKTLNSGNCVMEIPSIGTLIVRNNLVAVKFTQFIQRDTRNVLSQSLEKRKQRSNLGLTSDNLKKFASLAQTTSILSQKPLDFLEIDQNTKSFIKTDLGIHFNQNNMRRTTTNYDRMYASKEFNDISKSLKESQMSRLQTSRLRKSNLSGFNSDTRNIQYEYNQALRILKQWVNDQGLNTQSSFLEFMNLSKYKKDLNSILTETDIWNGCKQISIDITEQQAHELYRLLDVNKDGAVSFDDWSKVIKFDVNSALRRVIAFINKNKLDSRQVLERMQLKGISSVDVFKLKESLKKLLKQLSDSEAFDVSRYIANGANQVKLDRVLQYLQLAEQSVIKGKVDTVWQSKFYGRIKSNLNNNNILEEEIESKFRLYDKNETGFINQSEFKDVLNNVGVILTLSQLIKLVKTITVNKNNQLKYSEFVDKLRNQTVEQTESNELTLNQFINTLQNQLLTKSPFPYKLPISVQAFASELQNKYFQKQSELTLRNYLSELDLDKDGYINSHDLEKFRNGRYHETLRESARGISQDALADIIKKINEICIKKKYSMHELFKRLDTNKDGFINLNKFNNLDSIIKLEPHVKQALFRYFDKDHLDMFDYKTFLEVMDQKRTPFDDQKYDWPNEVVNKIRDWYQKSGLLAEDAFKVLDKDFDGYINENDFRVYLKNTLKYQQKELTHIRLQKLFKLFDNFKRGKIDILDFNRVLNNNVDWIESAKHQIGLTISRKYNSLSQAFNQISNKQHDLIYTNFYKWIKSNKATSGFMLNDNMIKELFSSLDPHKKGFISQNDFNSLFGKHDWKTSHALEFLETLKTKFKSSKQAYSYLNSFRKNGPLTKSQFESAVRQVSGSRFAQSDIKQLWTQIAGNQQTISYDRFTDFLGSSWQSSSDKLEKDYPRDSWVYQDYNIIKGTVSRTSQYSYTDKEDIESQCKKILQNVKDILRTSPKTLEEAFSEADRGNRGVVTNLEFKQAFRNLNIALTSKEIDLLLNFCDFGVVNLINWRDFIKRFNLVEDKKKIIDRAHPRMHHFSDLLHYFMINPKEAYRKFNNPSTGYMNFNEFYALMKELYTLTHEETLPEYTIIKDLFEFIDVRKDGKLDYQQWVQTFRNYNPPSVVQGTRKPDTKQQQGETNIPVRLQVLANFEQSQQYEEFTKLVGRNRKYLLQKFEQLKSQSPLLEYSDVERILKDLATQQKLSFDDKVYKNFVAFALTAEKIDYKLLLQAFKQRLQTMSEFPKHKVF